MSLRDRILDGAEAPIDFRTVAALPAFRRFGRPMAIGHVYRLAQRPRRGVVLETARVAGRLVTTSAAVERYLLAVRGGQGCPVRGNL